MRKKGKERTDRKEKEKRDKLIIKIYRKNKRKREDRRK